MFPLSLETYNTITDLAGGVNIQILAANLNEYDPDRGDFLSTMTTNVSALHETRVSCGLFSIMSSVLVNNSIEGLYVIQ